MTYSIKNFTLMATLTMGTVTAAHADSSLLFPYVISTDTAYTFISLFQNPYAPRNADQQTDKMSTALEIYELRKDLNVPKDFSGNQQGVRDYQIKHPGALIHWETSGRINLPSELDYPLISNPRSINTYGYMTIEYSDDSKMPGAGQMYGEALVVDTATGMVFSYPALHIHSANGDFSELGGTEFATSWLPGEVAGTSWYVLSLGKLIQEGGEKPSERVTVEINTNSEAPGLFGENGRYHEVKSSETWLIEDFGKIYLSDLASRAPEVQQGGWTTFKTSEPSLIWKIQQSGELGFPAATMSALPIVQ